MFSDLPAPRKQVSFSTDDRDERGENDTVSLSGTGVLSNSTHSNTDASSDKLRALKIHAMELARELGGAKNTTRHASFNGVRLMHNSMAHNSSTSASASAAHESNANHESITESEVPEKPWRIDRFLPAAFNSDTAVFDDQVYLQRNCFIIISVSIMLKRGRCVADVYVATCQTCTIYCEHHLTPLPSNSIFL
jgi:hypothetical protein